jgi:putative FmdB family regulatory protein
MPTYEYSCQNCGIFEEFHSISTTLNHCPKCGKEVSRLISRNQNIIFKGSGFHNTDYRSSDYQKKAASENPATSEKTGSSATTGATKETKPAQTESKAS